MKFELVVIGTSLGGLVALERLLEGLPGSFPVPIAVVQHRSVSSGEGLATTLQTHSALRVREPMDKEPIRPGWVYLAPADYHLLVEPGRCALSTEGPVRAARPSIDVLFESAADAYGERVIGVVLTGASDDGARGAAWIRQRGGYVIIQEPETAESAVMPRAALRAAGADRVIPLDNVAESLVELCRAENPL